MNYQFGPAAHGWGTVKLSGAAGQADATLKSLIEAAAVIQQPTALAANGLLDTRITGLTLYIVAATTFYWENNGTVADATKMPVLTGDTLEIKMNNRELLGTIHIVVTGAYDIRVMLW